MNQDITAQLKLAFSQSSSWNREKFIKYLDTLEELILNGKKDWDEYAGEKWGSVLVKRKALAYISREFPLLFLQSELAGISNSFQELVILYFSDNDIGEYSIDPNFLEKWSQGRSNTGGLDTQDLSASDIWWATIL